jgi:SAM-dependent methyltransferase
MNAIAVQTDTGNPQLDALKDRLRATWNTGNYQRFASYMAEDAAAFYGRLGVTKGARLLDVGCGSGQLSLIAARAGANVVGCDIAVNWLEQAREQAFDEGLDAIFEEGDAEDLPYNDAIFDVVASLVGAMFAPRPNVVAAELARVCRPGGMIAMGNWTPQGFIGQMFRAISAYIAPSGMPAPALWGDERTVTDRFQGKVRELRLTRHFYHFDYPFSPREVVEFYRINYGPVARAFAALDIAGQEALRSDLVALWSTNNLSPDPCRTWVEAEYLQVIAIRA